MLYLFIYAVVVSVLMSGMFFLIRPDTTKEKLIVVVCSVLWPLTIAVGTTVVLAVALDP